MKNTFTLLICFLFSVVAFSQDRSCAAMEDLEQRMQIDKGLSERMAAIEAYTQKKVKELEDQETTSNKIVGDIITIPVVVHVLYRNATENISDAQILSQIQVLNEDFRRTNGDADNIWSQAADTQIEFCLAKVDPNGNTTTGITRKSTTREDWGAGPANEMKKSASGGVDAWDTSQYLNMWICPKISAPGFNNLLGYAQFPGGDPLTDGVVMGYKYFGKIGTATAPFDLGRTTTHEVGHFLNLRHIWGDGGCGVDDFVSDTPESDASNTGCATTHTSCGSLDMVQNYMDYSDDSCMNLFTQGQKNRMRAVLLAGGVRASLGASSKCDAPTEPTCSDGIQNGNETGVDCGGDCAPCQTQYCESSGNRVQYEWIAGVQVESFNNTSGAQTYSDFTAQTVTLNRGESNSITLTQGYSGTAYDEYFRIWIDYNQDGDFSDAGELAFDAGSTSNTAVTGTITPANSVLLGTTRMRVSMKYNAAPNACGNIGDGEVEDYTVNITGPNVPTCSDGVQNGNETGVDCGGDCEPCQTQVEYCASAGTRIQYEWIAGVQIGSFNNTSAATLYSDFTSHTATLSRGESNSITLTQGYSGTAYDEYFRIWIDYNKDGDFNDAGELAFDAGSASNTAVNGTITPPASVSLGTTRMRVSMKYNAAPSACGSIGDGEVEDYTVNITGGNTRTFDALTLDLKIFPNPVTGSILNVSLNTTGEVPYSITNMIGQVVSNGVLNNNSNKINVGDLEAGLYLAQFKSGNQTTTKKFIKR